MVGQAAFAHGPTPALDGKVRLARKEYSTQSGHCSTQIEQGAPQKADTKTMQKARLEMNPFDGGYPMGEERDTSDLPGTEQEAQNQIMEKLGELYRAWAIHGPEDGYTINVLNNLMQLYDEWLD